MYKTNILQTIFSDHFEYVQYVIRPSKNVLDNINKIIHCHDPSYGGAGNFTPWRPNTHFDYDFLRLAFRKVLLEQLSLKLGPPFKKLKNQIYKDHPEGFHVRAKPNLCPPDVTIKYINSTKIRIHFMGKKVQLPAEGFGIEFIRKLLCFCDITDSGKGIFTLGDFFHSPFFMSYQSIPF